MLRLLDSMRDLQPVARGEAKNYLEGFFRSIEWPEGIRRQLISGCKPQPTM